MDPSKRRTLQTLAGLGALAALPRAWAQVRARPSVTGSPRPTMPASVWIFRKSQRGLTRKVSSFVILILSLGEMGALRLISWARASSTW